MRCNTRFLFLAAAVLTTAACDDSLRPGFGSIVIRFASSEPTTVAAAASGPAETPAPAALMAQDSAYVSLVGPTSKTQKLTLRSNGTFTDTLTALAVGSYTVNIYWYKANEVSFYNRVTNVTVTSGGTSPANITAPTSFVPTVNAVASTWQFRISATFNAVQNADSYKVEYANNANFTNATTVTPWPKPGNLSALLTFNATGTWSWRVRAANAQAPAGGQAATSTVTVSTDVRTRGSDLASAANLGFFATTTQTLDSLNIFPATDADWFSLSQCNGDTLIVSALAGRLSPASPLNSALQIYNSAGLLVAQNDDSSTTNTDAFVRIGLGYDNAYRIRVSGSQNTVGHYKLRIQGTAGANNATTSCRVVALTTSSVSAGLDHTCSIRNPGTGNVVDCWGLNSNGQLGIGTTGGATSSPVRVSGTNVFNSVSAGGFHTCAIAAATGQIYCWGSNFAGQLGDNTTTDRNTPVLTSGTSAYSKVAAGHFSTCGLASSPAGQVFCWGLNNFGQLGIGTTTNTQAPTQVPFPPGVTSFSSIGTGTNHTCAVANTGSIYCWGLNSAGQLGQGNTINSSSPLAVAPPFGTTWVEVGAGNSHTCARTSTNLIYCWGDNSFGQVGDGTFVDQTTPVATSGGIAFSSLDAGRNFTCARVAAPGTATYCWGSNFDGQLGDGTQGDQGTPTLVTGPVANSFTSVSAGGFHTCATGSVGTYCWGWNQFGQTGDNQPFNHTGPILVSGGQTWKQLSLGHDYTCGVTSGNVAYCWGWNADGQLGDGTFTTRTTPNLVAAPVGVTFTSIAAGAFSTCALSSTGAAYCWGFNGDGEIGDGTTIDKARPTLVIGGQAFSQIALGDFHACGRTTPNPVYCWGYNGDGQLGNGTVISSSSPALVSGGFSWAYVSAGGRLSCGLLTVSSAGYCWGDNSLGGLGNGTTTNSLTPTLMSGGQSWAALSAGYNFACGRTVGNAAFCWGSNSTGQLGTGNNTNSNAPVAVSGSQTWSAVTASRSANACGATAANVAFCWGGNSIGQIGDGTFSSRNSPTAVNTAIPFSVVLAGDIHTCGISGTTGTGPAYCWGNNEMGQLGNGTQTVRTAPNQVNVGPVTAPPLLVNVSGMDPLAGEPRWVSARGRAGSENAVTSRKLDRRRIR